MSNCSEVKLFAASKKTIVGTKWGFINEKGEFVIKPQFDRANQFQQNGLAIIKVNGRAGAIDETGCDVPEYDKIILLGENRAAVGKAHDPSNIFKGVVYAIADTESGRLFTDFIYDSVSRFQGEFSSVTKGVYSFFIKKNGVPAASLPLITGLGSLNLEGNVVIACMDDRTSYYDRHGNLIYGDEVTISH
jgi:hypothetical protein